MDEYLDVLLVCAAPVDVRPALNLGQELGAFEDEVRRASVPIRLRRVFPPTLQQLERELSPPALRLRQPRVFHFLGHGEPDGLWFENELGGGERIPVSRLKRIFQDAPIEFALLNACWSATSKVLSLCEHLVRDDTVRAAIGHGLAVADTTAIAFAGQFYAHLAHGRTVGEAHQQAANWLAERGDAQSLDIEACGDRQLRLTEGLAAGERVGRVEDGMPSKGYLPGGGFFCGRDREFLAISETLTDRSACGFGIWGMGGIGKTALALEVARRHAWRYVDGGVCWVDVRDVSPPSVDGLLRRAVSRLVPGTDDSDPVVPLVKHLQASPGMIVFDNLETLPATEHEPLARFLRQVPRNGSRVLLTARTRIAALDDLPDFKSLNLTRGLDDWSGAHYVYHYARAKDVRALQVAPREGDGRISGPCAKVSRRVSGHPKMIETAVGVARKGLETLDDVLDRLDGELESQLDGLLETGLTLVGQEGQRLLDYLPLFPTGQFAPEALRAAGGTSESAEPDETDAADDSDAADADQPAADLAWVDAGLEQLERSAFLEYDQDDLTYSFHQTLVDHVRRRGGLSPDQAAAASVGLLMFYAGYFAANRENYSAIERCAANALVLMESVWSDRDAPEPLDNILARMTDALGYYFQQRGLWQMGQRWHERAIQLRRTSEDAKDDAALAHELYREAILRANRGDMEDARQSLRECTALWEQLENQKGLSASLHQLAIVEEEQGNPTEARRLLQRSIAMKEALGDVAGRAASLSMLAQLEAAEGDFESAVGKAREAVELLEGIGAADAAKAKQVLRSIEALAAGEGRVGGAAMGQLNELMQGLAAMPPNEALAAVDGQLTAAQAAGETTREILLLLVRSALQFREQDLPGCDASLQQAEQALDRVAQLQREELTAFVGALKSQRAGATQVAPAESVRLHAEAMQKHKADEPEAALELLEASLSASREEQNLHNAAMNLLAIGQTLLMLRRADRAVERLREGLEVAAQVGDEDLSKALREVAVAAAGAVEMEKSLQQPLEEALAEAANDQQKAQVLLERAAALGRSDADGALRLAERAVEIARQAGAAQHEVQARFLKGMLTASSGRVDEAKQELQEAQALAEARNLSELASALAQAIAKLE